MGKVRVRLSKRRKPGGCLKEWHKTRKKKHSVKDHTSKPVEDGDDVFMDSKDDACTSISSNIVTVEKNKMNDSSDYISETEIEIDAELGLSEDHFSRPEGLFGFTTAEELEMAIENCKEMIFETPETSEKRKILVKKLIQLRFKLQEVKEGTTDSPPHEKLIAGHRFKKGQVEQSYEYCEKCCGVIWGVLNVPYRCQFCGFRCHKKCLNMINRKCAYSKVLEKPEYILNVCPEVGLSEQKYRCAECHRRILFKVGYAAPRRCDYNGLYYCSYCHWDSLSIIPARVISNWDFEPKKVCRSSLQFLRLMTTKPVLHIESLNPKLFSFIEELANVKKIREEILVMKQYFLTCHAALESGLLLQLKDRQHFIETSHMYSLQDLIDLERGALFEYVNQVLQTFYQHITQKCQSCQGKGFICEICQDEKVVFPFQQQTVACPQCLLVFHRECFQQKEGRCPRCERRARLAD